MFLTNVYFQIKKLWQLITYPSKHYSKKYAKHYAKEYCVNNIKE